jgi:hypothetical protein
MRKKCRMIPQKVNNSTIMDSKDSNVHRTSDLCLSFKSMIKNNQQNEEDMNKCMNEFWGNIHEQVSEINKKMKKFVKELHIDTEIFEKSN